MRSGTIRVPEPTSAFVNRLQYAGIAVGVITLGTLYIVQELPSWKIPALTAAVIVAVVIAVFTFRPFRNEPPKKLSRWTPYIHGLFAKHHLGVFDQKRKLWEVPRIIPKSLTGDPAREVRFAIEAQSGWNRARYAEAAELLQASIGGHVAHEQVGISHVFTVTRSNLLEGITVHNFEESSDGTRLRY